VRTAHVVDDAPGRAGTTQADETLSVAAKTRISDREYAMCVTAGSPVLDTPAWRYESLAGLRVLMQAPVRPPADPAFRCHGQLVGITAGHYDWIYLWLSEPLGEDAEVWLHYQDAADPEWLRIVDRYHPCAARIPVTRPDQLTAIRLPELAGAGVLAATLVSPSRGEGPAAFNGRPVDLAPHANCVGIEPSARPGSGAFNIWYNTFPAEDLPAARSLVRVGGVPFRFPLAGDAEPDNIRCRGQRIALDGSRADWLHVLAAAERRSEDVLTVHYADGTNRPQWLRVSDFWPETAARFGEQLAFRTSSMLYPNHVDRRMPPAIWRQRVPLTARERAVAVTLPDNPAIHLFAATLVDEAAAGRTVAP
jgi:hypothetical protein